MMEYCFFSIFVRIFNSNVKASRFILEIINVKLTLAYSAQISIPATKLQTSSTVQLETSSCNLGLSDSALFIITFPPLNVPRGVFVLGLFMGGAAAERSKGDEGSCLFVFFSNACNSASLAVLTIARRVWVVDISIRGGNIAVEAKGFKIEEKSGFFVSSLLLEGVGRFGTILGKGVDLKRGSKGGGNPFLAALK